MHTVEVHAQNLFFTNNNSQQKFLKPLKRVKWKGEEWKEDI